MHLADQFLIALGRSFFFYFCFKVIKNNHTLQKFVYHMQYISVRLEVAGWMSLGDGVWHSLNFAARVKV